MTEERDAVLFVNIPFCIDVPKYARGTYLTGDSVAKREYLEAVEREIATLDDVLEGKRIVAVRLGGGGPSVVNPDQLGALMRTVRATLPLAPGAEMTLEALPNTVGVPSLTGWGQGKPSRIELAAGAIHLRDLAELGRPFHVSDIQNAVLFLDKFGMNNVALALTYGIPGQTPESWKQTLRKGLDLEPVEVVIRPVTPADGAGLPREEQRSLYETAAALLTERGFAEYAPGRFARGAGASAYVEALAEGADVAAVGLGSVSCVDGMVWRTTDDFKEYCAASDDPERVVVDAGKLDAEAQTALAVRRGLCGRAGVAGDLVRAAASQLAQWEAEGLVEQRDDRFVLTADGRFAWQWNNEAL